MMAWAQDVGGAKCVHVLKVNRGARMALVRFNGRTWNIPTAALLW